MRSKLLDLQRAQYRHDEVAHRDIQCLLLPRRLTHFTLHFAKYQGRLAEAVSESDIPLLKRLTTDSLIIALAAANSMNLDLEQRVAESRPGNRTGSRARELRETRLSFLLEYAAIVGDMAKACEVQDHLENYPSRDVLERSTAEMVELCLRIAECEQFDLVASVSKRWIEVEAKSVLKRHEDCTAAAKTSAISAVA